MAEQKLRIPVFDPLGVLGKATQDMPFELFDPLREGKGSKADQAEKESDYVDKKVELYTQHLQEAYKAAPCSGCKNLTLSAIVGARIYQEMQSGGKKREDFTEEEIQRIKEQVAKELEGD